jgi:adenylate cyclase
MGLFGNIFGKEDTNAALEIERKFLVIGDFKVFSTGKYDIIQGYLSTDSERTVRVRIASDQAFLTIKGASDETGTTRFEWEQTISVNDAKALLKLCLEYPIEKTRYIVEIDEFIFEVDEFKGVNEGLIIAEVELSDPTDEIPTPEWMGQEVTNDARYYNSYLSQHPYSLWNDK